METLLILDAETTGLNPTTDHMIELGCVLFSLKHNCVLQQLSTLIPVSIPGESPTIGINGITAASAKRLAVSPALISSFNLAEAMVEEADAIAAHNAPFDQAFCQGAFDYWPDKPWIDTAEINWPRANRQGCNLVELALAYGVPVWDNHRALTDCQLLAHIIQRETMAPQLLAKELEPKVWATWRTSFTDKAGQAKARGAGFRWKHPDCPIDGVWSRRMHPDDVQGLGFEVVVLKEA